MLRSRSTWPERTLKMPSLTKPLAKLTEREEFYARSDACLVSSPPGVTKEISKSSSAAQPRHGSSSIQENQRSPALQHVSQVATNATQKMLIQSSLSPTETGSADKVKLDSTVNHNATLQIPSGSESSALNQDSTKGGA